MGKNWQDSHVCELCRRIFYEINYKEIFRFCICESCLIDLRIFIKELISE